MTNIADIATRVHAAQAEERAARLECNAAEAELRDLRAALQDAGNQLTGYRQDTSADHARRIETAEAKRARLHPLIASAEVRIAAAKGRIERARGERATLSEGHEVALAVHDYHAEAEQTDQALTAFQDATARLKQAEILRDQALTARAQADQARAEALDETSMSAAREVLDQARRALEDSEALVKNLAHRATDLQKQLDAARAGLETARRRVWQAKCDELLTGLQHDLAGRLGEAYVTALAAGSVVDFATFTRRFAETLRPPADHAALVERLAADLGVPARSSK